MLRKLNFRPGLYFLGKTTEKKKLEKFEKEMSLNHLSSSFNLAFQPCSCTASVLTVPTIYFCNKIFP